MTGHVDFARTARRSALIRAACFGLAAIGLASPIAWVLLRGGVSRDGLPGVLALGYVASGRAFACLGELVNAWSFGRMAREESVARVVLNRPARPEEN